MKNFIISLFTTIACLIIYHSLVQNKEKGKTITTLEPVYYDPSNAKRDTMDKGFSKDWGAWYRANTGTLSDLLNFLYHDCCSGCGVEIETRAC